MSSVDRLYEEEIVSAADLLLWQVPEVEEEMKKRKKLLLDYNSHLRKYDSSKSQLVNSQNVEANQRPNASRVFRRKSGKSQSEMVEDVETRKVRLQQSEDAVALSGDWVMQQFKDLAERKDKGEILEGPMNALVACQLHMMKESNTRLQSVAMAFPKVREFTHTLHEYDAEFLAAHQDRNVLYEPKARNLHTGMHFHQALPPHTPLVIDQCLTFLESSKGIQQEGLFRIPGSNDTVNWLKAGFDDGSLTTLPLDDQQVGIADVCTLLKLYLRELPEPLIEASQYMPLMEAMRSNLGKDEVASLVMQMRPSHVHTFGVLMHFLKKVTRHSDLNKMTAVNLATCFAPTILRAPAEMSSFNVLQDMPHVIDAVKLMIQNADRFPNGRA